MFRYAKDFYNHPFHGFWNELKKRISEIDNEKITDRNVVGELARLNKCIEYIDAYLNIIDHDFLTKDSILSLEKISANTINLKNNIEYYKSGYQSEHINKANNSVSAILKLLNDFYTIQPAVSEKIAHELLEKYKKDATDNINELTNKIDEFNKFYITVFGEQDSETGKRTGGLKAELEDRVQEFDKFKESQETEYSTLTEQIKSLLPRATSAGLASAYNDERKKFEKPLKKWNQIFIGSLSTMIVVTIGGFFFNSTGAESVIMEHLNGWLLRLPFYLPLIWLAIYAGKRRSELQRLDQEYAHKEASAKSYSSYKYQIENLNEANDRLASKLLDSIIDSTSRNPSETLGKHSNDTPIGEAVKTIEEVAKKIVDEKNKQ